MPLATLNSLTFIGLKAIPVHIEVHLSSGLPSFALVGLPDAEIRESRERVRSALINSGFEFPAQRITVNLAPADLPKGSAAFDLAIALGIAQASGQLAKADTSGWIFAGELSLSGALVGVRSPLALAASVRRDNQGRNPARQLMLPKAQAQAAAQVPGLAVYGANSLFEVAAHLVGHGTPLEPTAPNVAEGGAAHEGADMREVIGHNVAKRALLTAAAGQHHIRLVGPPGSGKSMLAQRLSGLLPALPFEESLDVAAIRSLKGEGDRLDAQRPYRNPHPSTSMVALIGGGNPPMPGEITLAHQGLLFTDEVLEYDRRALEALREPLETGRVNISRAGHQASFPARFLWVCAHNPCPCGWLGHPVRECRCSPEQVRRYQGRLSGPLADRLDISIEVLPVDHAELLAAEGNTTEGREPRSTADLLAEVQACRAVQLERQHCLNGELGPGQIALYCKTTPEAEKLLLAVARQLHLSARGLHRIVRVARTIADLDHSERIDRKHMATAIQYRRSLNQNPAGPVQGKPVASAA
ncbi:MAG: YifB family Mg chelatase-like AAA ATPase [Limnobacter sp.]|uniref:YifB family Mg chelatase-like AAA ATPase n=1 Tax=Limnobacter sp. TaxID=2003368 RepID=UPI00391B0124